MQQKGLPLKKAIDLSVPRSQVLIKATNPQLPWMLSKETNAKLASLKKRKDQKAAAKRAAPLKTTEQVAGHPVRDKECPIILKK